MALSPATSPNPSATGIVISRKANSKNTKPISIIGNAFGEYLTNNKDLNGAIIIKSNLNNQFTSLNINEQELFAQNTFFTTKESNQIISIDYSAPITYTFLATTSPTQLVNTLNLYQPQQNTTYILNPAVSYLAKEGETSNVYQKTHLLIKGNNPADFNNLTLLLQGSLEIDNQLSKLNVEKQNSTANIIVNNNQAKLSIK